MKFAEIHCQAHNHLPGWDASRQAVALTRNIDYDSLGGLVLDASKRRPSTLKARGFLVDRVHMGRETAPRSRSREAASESLAKIPWSVSVQESAMGLVAPTARAGRIRPTAILADIDTPSPPPLS